MKLLAVDIGNTTIGFAVMEASGKIIAKTLTVTESSVAQIKAVLDKIRRAHGISKVVICSVVPKVSKVLENILKKDMPVILIGRDIVVPIKNKYKDPKQVGQDRLVGAYGAMSIYRAPLIVIDLGTAITFDVISSKKEYLGGAIVPGIRLSAESLFLKTALLPRIDIQSPRRVIGKTTQESILSGLFYGYGSLCRGFIDLISQEMKATPKVVMTGGHTHLMKKFISPQIRIIDEDLVFKGIYFTQILQ